jgi:hypothetical protein
MGKTEGVGAGHPCPTSVHEDRVDPSTSSKKSSAKWSRPSAPAGVGGLHPRSAGLGGGLGLGRSLPAQLYLVMSFSRSSVTETMSSIAP